MFILNPNDVCSSHLGPDRYHLLENKCHLLIFCSESMFRLATHDKRSKILALWIGESTHFNINSRTKYWLTVMEKVVFTASISQVTSQVN